MDYKKRRFAFVLMPSVSISTDLVLKSIGCGPESSAGAAGDGVRLLQPFQRCHRRAEPEGRARGRGGAGNGPRSSATSSSWALILKLTSFPLVFQGNP